jgi:hypothetical protein
MLRSRYISALLTFQANVIQVSHLRIGVVGLGTATSYAEVQSVRRQISTRLIDIDAVEGVPTLDGGIDAVPSLEVDTAAAKGCVAMGH